MSTKIAIAAASVASLFVLSACTSDSSDSGSSGDGGLNSAEPSPTATVFEQQLPQTTEGAQQVITLTPQQTGKKFRADNIGVSFESTTLADSRLAPTASNLDEALESLGSPALRFGGNGLDRRTFWTSAAEKPPNSEQVAVAPDDLKRLKELVDVTGSTVTLGIPLGNFDPNRGADMAAHAVDILGDSLVGLAIGNEPNGYTVKDVPNGAVRGKGWSKEKYVK